MPNFKIGMTRDGKFVVTQWKRTMSNPKLHWAKVFSGTKAEAVEYVRANRPKPGQA